MPFGASTTTGGGTFRNINPPFAVDSGANAAGPFSGQITRGLLRHRSPEGRVSLRFMFNPSTITLNFNIDPAQRRTDEQSAAELAGNTFTNAATTSLDLLFDRTLDVARGTVPHGVQADVNVFMRMLGIENFDEDPAHLQDVELIFGSQAGALSMHGQIVGASVNYMQFAASMIPTRCVINISFEQVLRDTSLRTGVGVDSGMGAQSWAEGAIPR